MKFMTVGEFARLVDIQPDTLRTHVKMFLDLEIQE